MSRAFVNEEDQHQDDDVPEIRVPIPPGARNYMTPAGAERLQAELRELANGDRPKLAAAIARLPSPEGRGTEDTLRRQLRKVDRRVEYLTRMLAILEIVDPAKQKSNRVVFGAKVTVSGDRGEEQTYQIVGVDESEPELVGGDGARDGHDGRGQWLLPWCTNLAVIASGNYLPRPKAARCRRGC